MTYWEREDGYQIALQWNTLADHSLVFREFLDYVDSLQAHCEAVNKVRGDYSEPD